MRTLHNDERGGNIHLVHGSLPSILLLLDTILEGKRNKCNFYSKDQIDTDKKGL